ncbi:hypothetical protein [Actinotalea subterranea]|uniref:hypothetical protein n=1 Tax=Actinotalea subterranea TaxID=2607497 RepID=UPI0011EDEC19|nr:hypothetical protein [Actinotalea subterranea]
MHGDPTVGGRSEPPTRAFSERLAPLGSYIAFEQQAVVGLRDVPVGEPPWPAPGNPMLAWFVGGAVDRAAAEGPGAAILDLVVHAWREGGIDWERRVVDGEQAGPATAWPGEPLADVERHARAHLAQEPPGARALRAFPAGASPWPQDGVVMLEYLVAAAVEALQDGDGLPDVLLNLGTQAWREGGTARAAHLAGPPAP